MKTLTLNRPVRPGRARSIAPAHYINRLNRASRYRDRSAHLGRRAVSPLILTARIAQMRDTDWRVTGWTDAPLVFVG